MKVMPFFHKLNAGFGCLCFTNGNCFLRSTLVCVKFASDCSALLVSNKIFTFSTSKAQNVKADYLQPLLTKRPGV